MTVQIERVTREQVISLVRSMPPEKLARWYEYGLFLQSQPIFMPELASSEENNAELQSELSAWEAASDEDWAAFEQRLIEAV
jgi:hypothetical protein